MLDSMRMKLGTASRGLPLIRADAESNPPVAMLRQPHSLQPWPRQRCNTAAEEMYRQASTYAPKLYQLEEICFLPSGDLKERGRVCMNFPH